jgi:hypothetical protein
MNRLVVKVPKKEHLDGHEIRMTPIFPELRPHLIEAWERAATGSVYVLPAIRSSGKNLRTGLLRILEKAGIKPWPKLFQNLRASRETELMRHHPAHLVHAWLGNSREVAEDHYLMATDEDFDRAAGFPAPFPAPSTLVGAHQASPPETRTAVSPAIAKDTAVSVPPRGVEPRFSD